MLGIGDEGAVLGFTAVAGLLVALALEVLVWQVKD